MQRSLFCTFFVVLFLPLMALAGHDSTSPPKVGDRYQIALNRNTSQKSDNSSGGSSDRDALVERITGLRADGLELEYDLPDSATAGDRARSWQFPARVFKPASGEMQLLNADDLEKRLGLWLDAAQIPRSACGSMIFTWNAFRIECDPESVLKTIAIYDMRTADLREGASYQDAAAAAPVTLVKKTDKDNNVTFVAELQADPDRVRHARAEADVAVGEMMHEPVTLDQALQRRDSESVSGTITAVFAVDSAGLPFRRTTRTAIEITNAKGQHETSETTETIERKALPTAPPIAGTVK